MNKQKKILYLELLRVLAIFFVIFNHTGENGFFLFAHYKSTEIQYWLYLGISVFCKFSVPMFFMISGALMMEKEEPQLRKIWAVKIPRILLTLTVFSFGYYIFDCYRNLNMTFSWKEFWVRLYSSNLKYHLWYLYLYIAYLICMPFLYTMVKHLTDMNFIYMIILTVVFNGILSTLEYGLGQGNVSLNGNVKNLWALTTIVLYPSIGHYLNHIDMNKINKKILCLFWGINIICIGLSCYLTYYKSVVTGILNEGESQSFHGTYIIINCITLFITVRYITNCVRISGMIEKIILSLGSCIFGIYLWHAWFKSLPIYDRILDKLHHTGLNYMLSIWIVCLLLMLVSYLTTLIMSKIPGVRKLVGFK